MIKKTAQIDHYKESVSQLCSVSDTGFCTICSSVVFNTFPSSVRLVYILFGLNPRCLVVSTQIGGGFYKISYFFYNEYIINK